MLKNLKITDINFVFVFRHKWDNKDKKRYNQAFSEYRLGFLFKKDLIVGKKDFNNPKEWGKNLVNNYVFGIELIICKIYIKFNKGGAV